MLTFDEFQTLSLALYSEHPVKTRFVSKYRHASGTLVLKTTNGPTTLTFKTMKHQDLKKFLVFNQSFFNLVANTTEKVPDVITTKKKSNKKKK